VGEGEEEAAGQKEEEGGLTVDELFFLLVIWLLCACAAATIAINRGDNAAEFFFAGLFLGPFGILAAASKTGKQCPYCYSRIHLKADTCPRCQGEIAPDEPPPPE